MTKTSKHFIESSLTEDLRKVADLPEDVTLSFDLPCKETVYRPYISCDTLSGFAYNEFKPGIVKEIIDTEEDLDEANDRLLDNVFGENRAWGEAWMKAVLNLEDLRTAVFCYGKPGIGKSMLAEFLIDAVGDGISLENLDNVKRFNSDLRKPVIILEELNTTSSRAGAEKAYSIIKQLVTGKRRRIEDKFKKAEMSETWQHVWMNSNPAPGRLPLFIDGDDRRISVIQNDEAVKLEEIWTAEEFERWKTGELKRNLCAYLYHLKTDIDPNICLETEAKDMLKRATWTEAVKKNKDLLADKMNEIFSDEKTLPAAEVAEKLQMSPVETGKVLKENLGIESKVKKINGKAVRVYDYEPEDREFIEAFNLEGTSLEDEETGVEFYERMKEYIE